MTARTQHLCLSEGKLESRGKTNLSKPSKTCLTCHTTIRLSPSLMTTRTSPFALTQKKQRSRSNQFPKPKLSLSRVRSSQEGPWRKGTIKSREESVFLSALMSSMSAPQTRSTYSPPSWRSPKRMFLGQWIQSSAPVSSLSMTRLAGTERRSPT